MIHSFLPIRPAQFHLLGGFTPQFFFCRIYSKNMKRLMDLAEIPLGLQSMPHFVIYSDKDKDAISDRVFHNIRYLEIVDDDEENASLNRLACYFIMIYVTLHALSPYDLNFPSYHAYFSNFPKPVAGVGPDARNRAQERLSELMRFASKIEWTRPQTNLNWKWVGVLRDAFLISSPEMADERLPSLYQLLKLSPDTAKFHEWAKGCPEQYHKPLSL